MSRNGNPDSNFRLTESSHTSLMLRMAETRQEWLEQFGMLGSASAINAVAAFHENVMPKWTDEMVGAASAIFGTMAGYENLRPQVELLGSASTIAAVAA
ncbi:MAG: hypothetical protein ACT4QE_25615, partial [Anaerolineales bacterium]